MEHNLNLKINDRLEVWTGEESFRSLIMDLDNDEIKINIPVNEDRYLVLNTGESVEIFRYSSTKICYKFSCKVVSRGLENNMGYYKLGNPYNIKKVQRRKNFRIAYINKILYKNITKKDKDDTILYEEGQILDISAGGIRAKLRKKVKTNDKLLIKLIIGEEELEIKGIVVRDEDTLDGYKTCGISFFDITEKQCDKIIKQLFKLQRQQKSSGVKIN